MNIRLQQDIGETKYEGQVKSVNKLTELFSVDKNQLQKLSEFGHKHLDCDVASASGGALTYSFTPTSLGVIVKLTCVCGDKIDVTRYDKW